MASGGSEPAPPGDRTTTSDDESVRAFVLTRHWFERRNGLELVLWCASDRGPLRIAITAQPAVMFVPRDAATRAGRRRAVELAALPTRAPVDAVYFDSHRGLRAERDRLRAAGLETFEADVQPLDRFLMERFVTGALEAHGRIARRPGYVEMTDPAIRASDYVAPLAALAFDLETDGLDGALYSIAVAGAGGERVFMRGDGPAVDGVDYLPDERAVICAFLAHVAAADPDVLLGWNVVEFDLAYLDRRCRTLGVELTLGRARQPAAVRLPRRETQPAIARVPGRVVMDGIATLRSATWSFESFRLDDVARELVGRGKALDGTGDAVADVRAMFATDKAALAAYNLEDCRLVVDIFARADLLGFAIQRQALTGLPLDRQGGAVAAFDNLYLPRLHRHGYVAPDVGRRAAGADSPGGYVMESEPGLFRNVVVLDFKSLYPSIIRTFAIDPLGMAVPGDDPVPGFDGAAFARERHILPGLIETLWAARDVAKRRGDAAQSRAIKILMNSFYGVLGTPGCRFARPALASSITRRGHQILRDSRAFIRARGFRVIYGDTDSLFVPVGDQLDEVSARAFGAELAAELTAYWRDRLAAELRVGSALELEFETLYLRFFMPLLRGADRGSKKRYAGTVRTPDGTRVVIKGLEAVRTDWSPLARWFQRELFRRVFADEPYDAWIRQVVADLAAGRLDRELIYRKRLRRRIDDYERAVPPHVQAARKLHRAVREIRYVITMRGPEPVEARRSPIDYDHYLQRQLAPAADGVLRALGTDLDAIAGVQLRLFDG
jgi:DNA polymerase-2